MRRLRSKNQSPAAALSRGARIGKSIELIEHRPTSERALWRMLCDRCQVMTQIAVASPRPHMCIFHILWRVEQLTAGTLLTHRSRSLDRGVVTAQQTIVNAYFSEARTASAKRGHKHREGWSLGRQRRPRGSNRYNPKHTFPCPSNLTTRKLEHAIM